MTGYFISRPGEIKTKTDFTGQAEAQRSQRFILDRINRIYTILIGIRCRV